MSDDPPRSVPDYIRLLIGVVVLLLVSLAVPTVKFGRPFLQQFFISPFQFFILPLWLLAYFSVKTGVMPARSGPSIRRDQNPVNFWMSVGACLLFGAAMFVFNLWISWQVISRPR